MDTQLEPVAKVKRGISVTLLSWGSLALALAESLCVAAVGLSGIRVAIGLSSLISATAGGPARGFHQNALRIPFLALGALGSLLVLLLVWNEGRMRKNPASAWRIQPLTAKQKRSRRIQVVLAVVSLVVIGLELITHPWFHHEL
jgi:MFS family permease